MLTDLKNWFWADISIYPGNSGGPLILNNKLVGIVIQQPLIKVENSKDLQTRIPFGKVVKARQLLELIKAQIDKEKEFEEFHLLMKD